MVISYIKGDSIDRKVDIAKAKYGTNFNQPGSMTDTVNAMKKYLSNSIYATSYPLTYSGIQTYINKSRPILIRIGGNGVGHMLVLKGYDSGTSGTGTSVLYNDPWDGAGHAASYNYLRYNMSTGPWSHTIYFTN